MDKKIKISWEKLLNPKVLKSNILTASVYSMAYEMLKSCVIGKLKDFYTDGFNEDGWTISSNYKTEVLALDKNVLRASLNWLKDRNVVNEKDLQDFKSIADCRNSLVHEMFDFTSGKIEHDIAGLFDTMLGLLQKIELWWLKNYEMAIVPEMYPDDLDPDQVVPGRMFAIKMLVDIALGPETEAQKYYDIFKNNSK